MPCLSNMTSASSTINIETCCISIARRLVKSKRVPGVPTTTLALTDSPRGTDSFKACVLVIEENWDICFTTVNIWFASSRVGARTIAWTREGSSVFMRDSKANTNAPVFPVPDWDCPMKFLCLGGVDGGVRGWRMLTVLPLKVAMLSLESLTASEIPLRTLLSEALGLNSEIQTWMRSDEWNSDRLGDRLNERWFQRWYREAMSLWLELHRQLDSSNLRKSRHSQASKHQRPYKNNGGDKMVCGWLRLRPIYFRLSSFPPYMVTFHLNGARVMSLLLPTNIQILEVLVDCTTQLKPHVEGGTQIYSLIKIIFFPL